MLRPLLFGLYDNALTAGFFFVSFVILTQMVLINVVVAVLLDNFVTDKGEDDVGSSAQGWKPGDVLSDVAVDTFLADIERALSSDKSRTERKATQRPPRNVPLLEGPASPVASLEDGNGGTAAGAGRQQQAKEEDKGAPRFPPSSLGAEARLPGAVPLPQRQAADPSGSPRSSFPPRDDCAGSTPAAATETQAPELPQTRDPRVDSLTARMLNMEASMQLLHQKLDKVLFGMAGADMLQGTPAKRATVQLQAKEASVSA